MLVLTALGLSCLSLLRLLLLWMSLDWNYKDIYKLASSHTMTINKPAQNALEKVSWCMLVGGGWRVRVVGVVGWGKFRVW